MRIERSPSSHGLGPVSTRHALPARERAAVARLDAVDGFTYAPSDLDANGQLHVILYSESTCDLEQVRTFLEKEVQHAGIDRDLPIVNGFSAHLEPDDVPQLLEHLPEGVGIHVNRLLYSHGVPGLHKDAVLPQSATAANTPPPAPVDGVDPTRVVIGMPKVWEQGYTGKGIGVAVIDSGIYPHPDLKDKIVGWVDIANGKTDPYDTFGHGTHVAGDVAGTGAQSAGQFRGIAPDANLIGVRITTVAEAIKGLQWCIDNKEKYNIRVVNMSLGDFAARSHKDDPWAQAAERAIEAGLTVVVAAGNEGPDAGTVSTPGISPRVITVGAIDDKHSVDRGDDMMADFSSRGPTSVDGLPKPDVVAPGVSVYSTLAPGATLDVPELPHVNKDYIAISGTSMATPIVAGLAATLISANPSLTHDDIKKILTASADRYLSDPSSSQGYGLVDAPQALEMALAMKNGAPAPEAPPLPVDSPIASGTPPAPSTGGTTTTPAKSEERAPTIGEIQRRKQSEKASPAEKSLGLVAPLGIDGYLLNEGRVRRA